MHYYTLIACLVGLTCLPPALAVPASPEVIFSGPFPIDYNISTAQHPHSAADDDTMHILANCGGNVLIPTGDIEGFANALQNTAGNNYAPAQSYFSYTYGSAKVCVYNNYLFDNTHVSNWEVGWGVRSVREQCCPASSCLGGR